MEKKKYLSHSQQKEFVRSRTWRKFFSYKLWELIGLPLAILAIWKVPLWIGLGFINIFGIDAANTTLLCKRETMASGCNGISYVSVWGAGFIILMTLGFWIVMNYIWARARAEDELENVLKEFKQY